MNDEIDELIDEFMNFLDDYLVEDDDYEYSGYTSRFVERELRSMVTKIILQAQNEGIGEP